MRWFLVSFTKRLIVSVYFGQRFLTTVRINRLMKRDSNNMTRWHKTVIVFPFFLFSFLSQFFNDRRDLGYYSSLETTKWFVKIENINLYKLRNIEHLRKKRREIATEKNIVQIHIYLFSFTIYLKSIKCAILLRILSSFQ